MSTVSPTTSIFSSRQERLARKLQAAGLDAILLNPGPSLVYLTGLHFHLSERPVTFVLVPGGIPILVLPALEMEKTKNLAYPLQAYPYGEDPLSWEGVFRTAAQASRLDGKQIGVEPRGLRLLEYRLWQSAAPKSKFINAEESMAALRMVKDPSEITAMRKAAEIAQLALIATLPIVNVGITERELAAELTLQLLRAGCDPEVPFSPIVSGGLNSANPHATPTNRSLQPGDLLVIDWGAGYQGYFSDITRTFAIGEVDQECAKIAQLVLQANTAGRSAARPGVTASEVDQAARSVIEAAGYGRFFTHRTGHGLGMEGHEPPYIRQGNELILTSGMTFTVEPGIYLPGYNGVRIEDDVLITENGMESLTDYPREVTQLV